MYNTRRQELETLNAWEWKNFLPLPPGEGWGEGAEVVAWIREG